MAALVHAGANGRSPTWRWLAGVLVSLLILVGSYLYAQTQRRIDRTEDSVAKSEEKFESRLTRIEDKLDRLLERRQTP